MGKSERAKLLEFAKEIVKENGTLLMERWGDPGDIHHNSAIDFTTETDLLVEKNIRNAINEKYPSHAIVGEEFGKKKGSSDYQWLIDPIDGTKYFGREVPMFAIVLGLQYKGDVVLSTVYDPVANQMYSASLGGGAFMNGKRLDRSREGRVTLANSLIAMDVDNGDGGWNSNVLAEVFRNAARVRILGNASLSLCWCSMGALNGYVDLFGLEHHGKSQDILPPLLIAKEAGLKVEVVTVEGIDRVICSMPGAMKQLKEIVLKEY